MSKYIKAEDVREKMYHEAFETDTDMQKWDSGCWIRYKLFENVIESIPGEDVQPVRHGHWIMVNEPDENGNALYQCSECHRGETHTPIVEVPYCWHCGAQMDEEERR